MPISRLMIRATRSANLVIIGQSGSNLKPQKQELERESGRERDVTQQQSRDGIHKGHSREIGLPVGRV
jgi:hypothetical protein